MDSRRKTSIARRGGLAVGDERVGEDDHWSSSQILSRRRTVFLDDWFILATGRFHRAHSPSGVAVIR
jgi:hypothetical protein